MRRWWSTPCGRSMSSPRRMAPQPSRGPVVWFAPPPCQRLPSRTGPIRVTSQVRPRQPPVGAGPAARPGRSGGDAPVNDASGRWRDLRARPGLAAAHIPRVGFLPCQPEAAAERLPSAPENWISWRGSSGRPQSAAGIVAAPAALWYPPRQARRRRRTCSNAVSTALLPFRRVLFGRRGAGCRPGCAWCDLAPAGWPGGAGARARVRAAARRTRRRRAISRRGGS